MRWPAYPVATQRLPRAGQNRPAFTLLEVLLAMAIGLVLLAALYTAMSVQLRHAQAGRDAVEQSTLVRALLDRMSSDISASLPLIPPPSSNTGGSSSPASGSSPATNSASSTSQSSSSATAGSTGGSGPFTFNLGVQGDSSTLVLYISKVPREINWGPNVDPTTQPLVSDLRRVAYWLAGSDTPLGLARQEIKVETANDDTTVLPPNIPDERPYVIAEEVKSLTFSYFDGSSWQTSWDGTQLGADGVTPLGPPAAIAIVIGVAAGGETTSTDVEQGLKYYRQVVAIAAANGLGQQNSSGTAP